MSLVKNNDLSSENLIPKDKNSRMSSSWDTISAVLSKFILHFGDNIVTSYFGILPVKLVSLQFI